MTDTRPLFSPLSSLNDAALAATLQRRIDSKTKPHGALGRLETLAWQIGMIQGSASPQIRKPHVLVFAGDHGAARHGVSAYPQEVSWQMVENFLAGGAAISVFCRQQRVDLTVVDAGVNYDFGVRPGLIDAKIACGTENYLAAPAMTEQQCRTAIERGIAIAHELATHGCNLIAFGEMGIGNTASASLITHCLIHETQQHDFAAVIGRGTGLDDAGLALKQRLLLQALARGGMPKEPLHILCEYGGFEIAMMVGAMLGAAEKRMTLLIDGFIVTSALLIARAITTQILPYCVFAHTSDEPGHALQLAYLEAAPLLHLHLRLGEGTGAILALPLLQAAVAFLNDMASFNDAGVSTRSG